MERSETHINRTAAWHDVPPADYTLTCKILEQTEDPDRGQEFRIASVTRSVLRAPVNA